MTWIALYDTVREHRKTYALAERLKITNAHAVGLLGCLWTWAATTAEDGNLTPFPIRAISNAAGWEKTPKAFYDAMVAAGWIDQIGDEIHLHDWTEYAEMLIASRESTREKTRKRVERYRERKKRGSNAECNVTGNVTPSLQEKSASNANVTQSNAYTVPNLTVPYPTVPKQQQQEARVADAPGVYDPALAELVQAYEANICPLYPIERDKLLDWLDSLGEAPLRYAIEESASANRRNWAHVEAILRALDAEGVRTQAQIDERRRKWAQKSLGRSNAASGGAPKSFKDLLDQGEV